MGMTEETEQWLHDVKQPDYLIRMKVALKEKGMSQSAFARICGCSPSRISALLNGRYAEHTPKYIWKAAKLYLKL